MTSGRPLEHSTRSTSEQTDTGAEGPTPAEGRFSPLVVAGLVVLGLVPGLARLLAEVAAGPSATPAEGFVAPPALIAHAVSGTAFSVVGAFQFPTAVRRGGRVWHRRTGRVLVPLGLVAAVSALWLTLVHPTRDSGELLSLLRLIFGLAMAASIVLGLAAIRRRDVVRHRAWMVRAYAIGLGAGTQVFALGFGKPVLGSGEVTVALLTGAGWVINLAVAEWAIRRRRPRRPSRAAPTPRRRLR